MRIGIVILPDQRWSVAGRRWQRAEAYGFDHAWTYDHLGWRDLVDGPWFDSVPTLTAAAMVTRRIRLGTLVASPNFRHPVHFAREVTALDDISQGRLLLGLGAGGSGFDSAVLGAPELSPRQRVDRFAEFVELLGRILGNTTTTWRGEFYTAVDARSTPGPYGQPSVLARAGAGRPDLTGAERPDGQPSGPARAAGPPFVVAANGPRTMRLAARHGDGWVTTGADSDDLPAWWRSVGEAAERFDEALERAGRPRDEVARYLSLDAAPVYSLSSVDAFTDAVGQAAALGFTDAITHWPRASSWYAGDEKVLESVATQLPRLRLS